MEKIRDNRWVLLAIICIGFFMILIDTTVVNVAIPTIIKELHTNLTDIEWVISGYALTFAALLITFGRLGDLWGRRNMFILGLFVFIIGSFFSGEAGNANILIYARLFQGIGGAMVSPSSLSLLSSTFKGRERGIAFGIWGGIAGLAVAVGPILGGFLTTYYSWRWIFRINIPIGIIGIIVSYLFIKNYKGEKEKIDISGMFLSAIGFFLIVFALIEGQTYGWLTQTMPFSVGNLTWNHAHLSIIAPTTALGIIFLVAFILLEHHKTKDPNGDPSINTDFFKFKTYRYGLITIAILSLGEFSSLFSFPIFIQSVKGFSPVQSGLAVLPLALATLIAAPLAGRLTNSVGAKWIVFIGLSLEFIGIFSLGHSISYGATYPSLIPSLIIFGTGIGLAIAQNTQLILFEIPHQYAGSASGVLNTVRQVGSALGIAIIGAILAAQLTSNITNQVDAKTNIPVLVKQQIISSATKNSVSFQTNGSSSASSQPIPPQIKENPKALAAYIAWEKSVATSIKSAVYTGVSQSISNAMQIASIFILFGAIISLLMPNLKHVEEAPAEIQSQQHIEQS